MTNAEAWFNIPLRPRKPEGSLGRTAQDGHLDSHTAPELCSGISRSAYLYNLVLGEGPYVVAGTFKSKDLANLCNRVLFAAFKPVPTGEISA